MKSTWKFHLIVTICRTSMETLHNLWTSPLLHSFTNGLLFKPLFHGWYFGDDGVCSNSNLLPGLMKSSVNYLKAASKPTAKNKAKLKLDAFR